MPGSVLRAACAVLEHAVVRPTADAAAVLYCDGPMRANVRGIVFDYADNSA